MLYVITFKQHGDCSGGVASAGADQIATTSIEAVIRAAVTRRLPGDSILTAVLSIMAFSSLNNTDSAEPVAMDRGFTLGWETSRVTQAQIWTI
jgi:hypothetical protein